WHCAGAQLELDSFPTRRSSDLVCTPLPVTWHTRDMMYSLERAPSRCLWAAPVAREPSAPPGSRTRSGAQRAGNYAPNQWLGVSKSEEHTSELQSREKLVCRLLL